MTRPIISKNTYYSGGLKAMSRLLFSNDDAPVFSYVAVAWADDIALGLGSQNVGSKSKVPCLPLLGAPYPWDDLCVIYSSHE